VFRQKKGDSQAAASDIDGLVSPDVAAVINAKRRAREAAEVFDVLPENWTALQLFLECADQWAYSPSGRLQGLRNEAVQIEINNGGYAPFSTEDWRRLRTLSRVATHELNRT
jgi:hypothetical protein